MPLTSFADGFATHRIIAAADRSATEGRTVKIGELEGVRVEPTSKSELQVPTPKIARSQGWKRLTSRCCVFYPAVRSSLELGVGAWDLTYSPDALSHRHRRPPRRHRVRHGRHAAPARRGRLGAALPESLDRQSGQHDDDAGADRAGAAQGSAGRGEAARRRPGMRRSATTSRSSTTRGRCGGSAR